MALTYHYRILPGKKGSQVKTPSIPVRFKGNSTLSINAVALVDSGADCSVLPMGLAEVLNLDLTGPRQDSFGLGGKIECIESSVAITLKQNHERYEFRIPVLVTTDDTCPIILGRNRFFEKLKITFDGKNQKLVLKRFTA
ncbi:MAG: retroviral-like aspartic protease [Anaerohalosphaera sp.]|nr:retroviral-like aspartic protease [Anaerohalosphaera sp.]